jgi:general secretion pathway protein G
MYRGNRKSGFTLVEILIVVIILGILAAIVIPQFTNASTEARWSSTASLLQTLRSQIELYKLQHGDALPDLIAGTDNSANTGNWVVFTGQTTFGTNNYGPYMQQVPKNPMNGLSTIEDLAQGGTPAGGNGWAYDYNTGNGTGKIWATDQAVPTTPGTHIFDENTPSVPATTAP